MRRRATHLLFAVCSLIGCGAPSVPPSASRAPDPARWSEPDEGIRGRLVIVGVRDDHDRAQVRVALELENVSDQASPIMLRWTGPGDALGFFVKDESGQRLEDAHIGGNDLQPPPYKLMLPNASFVHMTLSQNAIEYVPSGRVLLRPLALQAFDITGRTDPLALGALIKLSSPPDDIRPIDRTLSLPPVPFSAR